MTELDPAQRRTAVIEALGVLGSGPEERFDRITRMTHEAFGVPLTFLNLVHHDLVTTQSTFGWQQGTSVPASEQFCATTVLSPEPMVIPDTTLDPRFAQTAAVAEHGIRFYAGAPLSMQDGTRVGTLCVMDAQPRVFSDEDLALLRDLARWAERELGHSIERGRVQRVLQGLLPGPVAVPGWTVDALTAPSDESGDVVDWRVAASGRLHLTTGTVPAAGRAAALLAAAVRSAVVARTDRPLPDMVTGLEAQLTPDLSAAGTVATLAHLRLDPDTGRVEHVDAGQALAAVVRAAGGTEALGGRTLPLGVQPDGVPRQIGSAELGAGDRLLLGTEGAIARVGGLDALVDTVRSVDDGAAALGRLRPLVDHGALLVVARR